MKFFPFHGNSLLWRILLSTSATLTAAFALTGWIVQRKAAAISQTSLEGEIRSSLQAYESSWKLRAGNMIEISRIMSAMSDVRAAFMTGDRATIQDTAGQLWSQISKLYATFLVMDPTGQVIASLGGRPTFSVDPTLVRTALTTFPRQVSGYVVRDSHLYYVVLTPVYVQAEHEQELLDVLLIAVDIDDELAKDLKNSANGSEFAFVSAHSVLATTLPQLTVADIAGAKVLLAGVRHMRVTGADYLMLGTDLLDTTGHLVGHLYVARSLATIQATIGGLRRAIALFWVAGVVVALLLTYILFRRVLRPVQTLDRAAAEVIKRNYDYRVPVETRDELGRLAITFNQMCDSIRTAREDLIRQEQITTIGRLSTSIVHDLRNPLAAIYGGSEMLVDAVLSDEQRHRLAASIYSSSRRIQELLQELLDVSRARTKAKEGCTLADLVMAAREHMLEAAIAHSVAIEVDVPLDLEILVSRDRLERVFVNLIENAIDAMPDGGSVHISAHVEQGQALIAVEDTGPGISEEASRKLFQPFASFGKKNGLGLGLALSRQVLLDHGGDLWVDRTAASGAHFLMRLAITPASVQSAHMNNASIHQES